MTTMRQDAWTQDEDLLLAEVVLRYIREGKTQLAAFEEVGKRLSRTAAACGFRWNSYVRKQYKTGIELAKKQRKELRKTGKESQRSEEPCNPAESKLSLREVISFLQKLEQNGNVEQLQKENEQLRKKVELLEEKIMELEKEKTSLEQHIQEVEDDYRSLMEIMERARKMVVLQESEKEKKVKFQMDRNGNLERLEK